MSGVNYEKMNIQWFPRHMTKAQRMIEDSIKQCDAVCEILDARIPDSSRNPDIDRLAAGKPRLIILNRCDLADPKITAQWRSFLRLRASEYSKPMRKAAGESAALHLLCVSS